MRRLGLQSGQVVQELGWDEDCDDDLRADIEDVTGSELVDAGIGEVADVVLLWWRDGDGDLVDALVDAKTDLTEGGVVWLLTPKVGQKRARRPERRVRRPHDGWAVHNDDPLRGAGLVRNQARRAERCPRSSAMNASVGPRIHVTGIPLAVASLGVAADVSLATPPRR